MKSIPHTTEKRSLAHFSFFKAICCDGKHFLCDFSNQELPENRIKYLVDIEIPGQGTIHVEMHQSEDSKWHANMPLVYNGLEDVLDDAIYTYTVLN